MAVKNLSLILIVLLPAYSALGHAESVYRLKDESGATVYSDRPDLQGTTNAGTVELNPGPSAEEQQAAEQKVERMEKKSEEMRQSRMEKEQQRNAEQDKNAAAVEEMGASGVRTVDGRRLRDPKARIPVESPDGGEHPIYEPGTGRPVHIAPRPRARAVR